MSNGISQKSNDVVDIRKPLMVSDEHMAMIRTNKNSFKKVQNEKKSMTKVINSRSYHHDLDR